MDNKQTEKCELSPNMKIFFEKLLALKERLRQTTEEVNTIYTEMDKIIKEKK